MPKKKKKAKTENKERINDVKFQVNSRISTMNGVTNVELFSDEEDCNDNQIPLPSFSDDNISTASTEFDEFQPDDTPRTSKRYNLRSKIGLFVEYTKESDNESIDEVALIPGASNTFMMESKNCTTEAKDDNGACSFSNSDSAAINKKSSDLFENSMNETKESDNEKVNEFALIPGASNTFFMEYKKFTNKTKDDDGACSFSNFDSAAINKKSSDLFENSMNETKESDNENIGKFALTPGASNTFLRESKNFTTEAKDDNGACSFSSFDSAAINKKSSDLFENIMNETKESDNENIGDFVLKPGASNTFLREYKNFKSGAMNEKSSDLFKNSMNESNINESNINESNINESNINESSIPNDSGVAGDFPDVVNTDEENSDLEYVEEEIYDIDENAATSSDSDHDENSTENDVFEFTNNTTPEETDENPEKDIEITVARSLKTAAGKRIYDKSQYCPFCGTGVRKFARHITSVHADEEQVKDIIQSDKNDPVAIMKRSMVFDKLRHLGNFHHNMKVLRVGGELVVWRRPNEHEYIDLETYKPCPHCLAFVTISEMYRHVKNCKLKDPHKIYSKSVTNANLLYFSNKYSSGASKDLREFVLSSMNKDEITKAVCGDEIISTLGSFLLASHGLRKGNLISQRMRLLARLLLLLRKKYPDDGIDSLKDYMRPIYFDRIIESVKEMAGYELSDQEGERVAIFKKPSVALKVGYALEKCCSLVKGVGLKSHNKIQVKDAEGFNELYQLEWSVLISSVSLRSLSQNKFNKVNILPLTEDLLKLRNYLMKEIPLSIKKLGHERTVENWRHLAEVTGIRLTVFNRRRISEVFNLLIDKFNNKDKCKDAEIEEVTNALSSLEKQLMNSLSVVYVKGKRGRQVPVLMTKLEEDAIKSLIKFRKEIGVSQENVFVFGVPTRGSKKSIRGNDAMMKVLNEVEGIKYASRIKSTQLRKYCATVTQLADINENTLGWLADHMGHNLQVHREFYRLRESTVELTKVARLLCAIDEGNTAQLAGKKLSEIEIQDLPPLIPNENENDEFDVEDEVECAEQDDENCRVSVVAGNSKEINEKMVKGSKRKWSAAESDVVLSSFQKYFINEKLPGKSECSKLIDRNPVLKHRKWSQIKDFVRNHKTSVARKRTKTIK